MTPYKMQTAPFTLTPATECPVTLAELIKEAEATSNILAMAILQQMRDDAIDLCYDKDCVIEDLKREAQGLRDDLANEEQRTASLEDQVYKLEQELDALQNAQA